MRRLKNYSLAGATEEPLLTYRDRSGKHTVPLHTGYLYEVGVDVFREGLFTHVLSYNHCREYVGIETFLGDARQGELFLHGKKALEDVLGQNALRLTILNMAKGLAAHVQLSCGAPPSTPSSQDPVPRKTRTFEINLEDLKDEVREAYLKFVGEEPVYGPLATFETDEEDEDDKGADA